MLVLYDDVLPAERRWSAHVSTPTPVLSVFIGPSPEAYPGPNSSTTI